MVRVLVHAHLALQFKAVRTGQAHVRTVAVAAVAGLVALVTKVSALGVHAERVLFAWIALHLDALVNVHTAILIVPVIAALANLASARTFAAAVKCARLIAGQAADCALLSFGRLRLLVAGLFKQMLRLVQVVAEAALLARFASVALVTDALSRAFLRSVASTVTVLRANVKRSARTFLAQIAVVAVRTADHKGVHAQIPDQIFVLRSFVVPPVVQRCIVRLVECQALNGEECFV